MQIRVCRIIEYLYGAPCYLFERSRHAGLLCITRLIVWGHHLKPSQSSLEGMNHAKNIPRTCRSVYAPVYVLAMFWPSCVVQTVNSVNSDKEGADKRPARSLDASLDDFQILGGFKSRLRHHYSSRAGAIPRPFLILSEDFCRNQQKCFIDPWLAYRKITPEWNGL